ncbi:hypothetical protein ACPOL_4546 [Acidisarcina polymorpha]|uniref:Double-GTPase 2 domain-containing protein n=1 Tax=Acidisarcina polymorpha TaxID=2211140 RepID=A0A2Z5G3Y1_9BACT|nr:hypothetical protein [Acidisarcina polymorpha]AXC13818.1 hypothetical protein ACPOL_4546 [Acidisarcina polymorpha]
MIKLHPGLALKADDVYQICRGGDTKIVALMGTIGCGKTTLIAGIFQAFLEGSVAGYSFRRSDTLVAFEEKCFNSRTSSESSVASMPRTSGQVGAEFYHLEVVRDADRSIHRILLLDLSGEVYEGAMHVEDDAAKLTVLRDVSLLVQLIDGKKLSSGATREKVYSDAKGLLRRLFEVNSITAQTPLQVVVSKVDQLVGDDTSQRALEAVRATVASRFAKESQRPHFEIREIAASPAQETTVPMRFGVNGLLSSWLADEESAMPALPKLKVSGDRLQHRLGEVWMPERFEASE